MTASNCPTQQAADTLRGMVSIVWAAALSVLCFALFDGPGLAENSLLMAIMFYMYFGLLTLLIVGGVVRYAWLTSKR